ncbi:sulfotransferase [Mesorhizobium sp. B2-7-1]|uniref:sulfotransferase n=1 Tax=Mesorhizobium sp. B2-7-1 TaxID=2589909 RepID=UPI001FEEFB9A|nr:sulfotransferase [Mesorhizobium sp. B2-7-1]
MIAQPILTASRHGLIVSPDMLPGGDGININGPSLIGMPDWAEGRLGAYYLYFADHGGTYIRLAYSDSIHGPWRIHPGGVLSLDQCPFIEDHIASPDVHVDQRHRRFVMYFHGPAKGGKDQVTFAATSGDGLHFNPLSEPLGPFYARFFHHDQWWYGLLGTGAVTVFRSRNGISDFERGPVVLPAMKRLPTPRHLALQKSGRWLRVYYTRMGDAPERILHGTIDLAEDWRNWTVQGETELLRPRMDFEGAGLPVRRSRTGAAEGRENALRDPAIFEENGRTWLLYAVAGESGIALAEITSSDVPIKAGRPPATALRRSARRVFWRLRKAAPRLPSAMTSRKRIFIAGCARSGTTLSRRLMGCFDDTYVHADEAPFQALVELDRPQFNLVVKRTYVSHKDIEHLPASVGLIYCVRHPFDVLTSSHPETVNERRFHVTTERWEAEYDGLMRLRHAHPERAVFYLRYEELIAEPDIVQARIARSFDLSPVTLYSRDTDNPIRATSLRKWERNEEFRTYLHGLPPAFLARVESFCREFGYETPDLKLTAGAR